MLEIEKRGLLNEEKYNELLSFLSENAKNLGEDDKDVVYYIYDDKLLKVVNNLSKNNAKISLKMNKLGDSVATEELEVFFDKDNFLQMKKIIEKVCSPKQIIEGEQKRKNFMYKECEISVKWSKDYQYHFEIEKMTENKSDISLLEKEIDIVLSELGLISMTNDEIKSFQKKIEETAKDSK